MDRGRAAGQFAFLDRRTNIKQVKQKVAARIAEAQKTHPMDRKGLGKAVAGLLDPPPAKLPSKAAAKKPDRAILGKTHATTSDGLAIEAGEVVSWKRFEHIMRDIASGRFTNLQDLTDSWINLTIWLKAGCEPILAKLNAIDELRLDAEGHNKALIESRVQAEEMKTSLAKAIKDAEEAKEKAQKLKDELDAEKQRLKGMQSDLAEEGRKLEVERSKRVVGAFQYAAKAAGGLASPVPEDVSLYKARITQLEFDLATKIAELKDAVERVAPSVVSAPPPASKIDVAVQATDDQELLELRALKVSQQQRIKELEEQNEALQKKQVTLQADLADQVLRNEALEQENKRLADFARSMTEKLRVSDGLAKQLEALQQQIEAKESELGKLRGAKAKEAKKILAAEKALEELKVKHSEVESQMLRQMFEMMQRLQEELAAFHGEFKDFAARPVVKPGEDVVVGTPDAKGKPKAEVADGESQTETKVVDEGSQTETQSDSDVVEEFEVDEDLAGSRPDLLGGLATLDEVDDDSELVVDDEEEEEEGGLEVEDAIEEEFGLNIDFDLLLERAAEVVFHKQDGQTTKGDKRMLFKNFVSALDQVLQGRDPESFTDQERLEKSSFEAMLAINFEQDGEEMSISFVDALQNEKFKAEFLEWAEEKASAIADNSDKYNVGHHHTISDSPKYLAKHPRVAPPDASPGQPLSTEPIAKMLGNLESIKSALR